MKNNWEWLIEQNDLYVHTDNGFEGVSVHLDDDDEDEEGFIVIGNSDYDICYSKKEINGGKWVDGFSGKMLYIDDNSQPLAFCIMNVKYLAKS